MRKSPQVVNEITLHNKRLVSIWQHDFYKQKSIKHIDGLFVFNNIFSVHAYSTRKEESVTVAFARKASEKISDRLAQMRSTIRGDEDNLNRLTDSIELNKFTPAQRLIVTFDKEKLTPPSAALVKVFIFVDNYNNALNKARFNGDISPNECDMYRNRALKALNVLLNDLHKMCIQFHKVRKEKLEG